MCYIRTRTDPHPGGNERFARFMKYSFFSAATKPPAVKKQFNNRKETTDEDN